jgi:quercetin dioxygenase-like cupin family protein
MNITSKAVNFQDDRGTIRDIFPHDAPDCITLIVSAPHAMRGNHVHARSHQYVFVITGQMWVYSQIPGALVERCLLGCGDLLMHAPGEAHAYVATDSGVTFLAMADGLRKGEAYETDTERVPSLIDAWKVQEALP